MGMFLLLLLSFIIYCSSYRFVTPRVTTRSISTSLYGTRQRAWAKGDLSDKDIFEDEDDPDYKLDNAKKNKLEAEVTFFEGPPSPTEMIFPALSILTVIGIIPFISSVSRQLWVRYKFTSRRISITSGVGGNDQSTIIYPDVEEIRFVFRALGECGDMVLFLKDGAKVEMRHVPNFVNVLKFVMDKCDEECREKSMKIPEFMLKQLQENEAEAAAA